MSILSSLINSTLSPFNDVISGATSDVEEDLFNLPDLVYPETLNNANEGNTSLIMFTILEVGGVDFLNSVNLGLGINQRDDIVTGRRIYLYMPETVQDTVGVSWNLEELGVVGRVADSVDDSLGITETIAKASLAIGDSATRGASKLLGNLTGTNFTGARKFEARKIINPFMEMLFSNVENRQFNFTFKFTPKNEKEATVVFDIIKLFRMAAVPSFETENRSFIKFPNLFGIKYIDAKSPDGNNKWLPRIGKCALTSIDTNFSGAGQYSSHHDGSPKEIHLTLQFTEMQWLTKTMISSGM